MLLMEKLILIALGGALGAISRFGVNVFFQRFAPDFPWGILTVNLAGSFTFGLVWSLSVERGWVEDAWRDALLVGFLGALTTFSAFAFNNFQLTLSGAWVPFGLNIIANNVGGIGLAWLGVQVGRIL